MFLFYFLNNFKSCNYWNIWYKFIINPYLRNFQLPLPFIKFLHWYYNPTKKKNSSFGRSWCHLRLTFVCKSSIQVKDILAIAVCVPRTTLETTERPKTLCVGRWQQFNSFNKTFVSFPVFSSCFVWDVCFLPQLVVFEAIGKVSQ